MLSNLRRLIARYFDIVVNRASRFQALRKLPQGGFDILEVARLKAAFDTADYYERNLITANAVYGRLNLLTRAITLANPDGLWLEFGVASGTTIRHLADLHNGKIYGFDSFQGLPERWFSLVDKGKFAGPIPVVPDNVELVTGWFSDTLPLFLSTHTGVVSFLHVDCDLYSSTKTIFDWLGPRLTTGSVIVFDEYWNYPGWRQHEHRAFLEYVERTGIKYQYDSFAPDSWQVCVVLT